MATQPALLPTNPPAHKLGGANGLPLSPPRVSPCSTRSSSRCSSISFAPARYVPTVMRPLVTTLLVHLRYCVHALQLKQPLLARLAINQLLKREEQDRVMSQLPHPVYFQETLVMAVEFFRTREWRKAGVVLEELQEYLDFLSIEMVCHGRVNGCIFPLTAMDERRTRLFRRLQKWTSSKKRNCCCSQDNNDDEEQQVTALRWRLVSGNPIYRDLVFFALWAQQEHLRKTGSGALAL